jgi:hypothetical protein
MADEKPQDPKDTKNAPIAPGTMLPADQGAAQRKNEERDSVAALNKPNTVIQNAVPTTSEHPGVPSILTHLRSSLDSCGDEPDIDLSTTDDLVNQLANHLMLTTSDVILHEKLKHALEVRGFRVVAGPAQDTGNVRSNVA